MDCPTCQKEAGLEPVPRWKAPLAFVGVLLFCPCHLPVTFAAFSGIAVALGAAWFATQRVLVYVGFSLAYLLFLFVFVRWVLRSRDRERQLDQVHAGHAAEVGT